MQAQGVSPVQNFCLSLVQEWAVAPQTQKKRTEAEGRRSTAGVRLQAAPQTAGRTAVRSLGGSRGRGPAPGMRSHVHIRMRKGAHVVLVWLLLLGAHRALPYPMLRDVSVQIPCVVSSGLEFYCCLLRILEDVVTAPLLFKNQTVRMGDTTIRFHQHTS